MGQLTLITGGAFTGKSAFAKSLLPETVSVLVIATAQVEKDEDLKQRAARYRAARPALWSTIEAPWQVAQILGLCGYQYGAFWVNCIPEYMKNFLERVGSKWTDEQILVEIDRIIGAAELARGQVVVETRENFVTVPTAAASTRRLGGLIGAANERLAAAADGVYRVEAGIVQQIK